MESKSNTITEYEYNDALSELIDKLNGQIFDLKNEITEKKKNNFEKLEKKFKTAKSFITPILENKKKINIASKMIDIFNELLKNFNKNQTIEKKKLSTTDKNDINVINAIFIEKKLNEIDDDDDDINQKENDDKNNITKNKLKEYAEKLYEDDFDNIENGMDERIDKEYKSYFDDNIEIEENELKKEYDDLCKEFKIEKPEEKPKEKPQENYEQKEPQKNYEQDQVEKYYDIVFEIESLENLKTRGWELKVTEKGQKKYEENKDKNCTLVSVLGSKNTGKSFILSKISNIEIPHGVNISTKGLSIIYPDYDEKNIICLDTAGFEVPLCEDDKNFVFKIEDEKEGEKYEAEKKNDREISIKDYLSEDEYITQIQKFIRDKQLTNEFIKKFVINVSNINIYIVNSELDLTEQNFYTNFLENKNNIIIHNLKTFYKISEVKDYIENYLLNSIPFRLEKSIFTIINDKMKYYNQYYYKQIFEDKKNMNIIHLIMANENSEAGSYYNESTIYFIKKLITTNLNFVKFPIIDKVKDFLIKHSVDFFNEPLDKNCELEINNECLKFKDNINYILKECSFNDLGIPLFIQSNYLPNYIIYKGEYKDEGKKLFIDIEVSGKVTFDEINFNQNDGQNIVMIKGKRILTEEEINKIINENKLSYLNNYFKVFNLRLFIKNDYGVIQEFYKVLDNKGIYTLIFNIFDLNNNLINQIFHIDTDNEESEEDYENE